MTTFPALPNQVPVNDLLGGLYGWRYVQPGCGRFESGGVIVLGKSAGGIAGRAYKPGTEAWFLSPPPLPGIEAAEAKLHWLTLQLVTTAPTSLPGWVAAAAQLEASAAYLGSTTQDPPKWIPAKDRPIPSSAVVLALKSVVVPGSGTADQPPLDKVAIIMNLSPRPFALPTWYVAGTEVLPLFGKTLIVDGIAAVFEEVAPGQAGYPETSWISWGPSPR